MAEVRDRMAWNRTFARMAQHYNLNRDPKKDDPIDPLRFFPWKERTTEKKPGPPTAEELKILREAFPGKN